MRTTLKVWIVGADMPDAITTTVFPHPNRALAAANGMIGRATKIEAWDDLSGQNFMYYEGGVAYVIRPFEDGDE